MEFWGVEVKPGQKLTCDVEAGKVLHLSLAALGETKIKGCENAPIFVNFKGQKLVLGTLNEDNFPQIPYDLVFEKDFELSHGFKNSSVYFTGYRTELPDDDSSEEEDCPDCDSEDIHIATHTIGKVKVKNEQNKPSLGKADTGKVDNSVAKAKAKKEESAKSDKPTVSDDDDDDDDDEDFEEDDNDDDSDDDEDMLAATNDSSDEEASSEDEDEDTPKKAAISGQKRSAESASKTPVQGKKAKVNSPAGKQKTGGDGKKSLHTATPHPAKKAEKAPAKQLTPKSVGSVTCKSCSKSFNSENALQAHSKAKHSGSK